MPFWFVPTTKTLFLRTRAYTKRDKDKTEVPSQDHHIVVDDESKKSRLYIPMGTVWKTEADCVAKKPPVGVSVWEDPEA
jgi:hypothetical protein